MTFWAPMTIYIQSTIIFCSQLISAIMQTLPHHKIKNKRKETKIKIMIFYNLKKKDLNADCNCKDGEL